MCNTLTISLIRTVLPTWMVRNERGKPLVVVAAPRATASQTAAVAALLGCTLAAPGFLWRAGRSVFVTKCFYVMKIVFHVRLLTRRIQILFCGNSFRTHCLVTGRDDDGSWKEKRVTAYCIKTNLNYYTTLRSSYCSYCKAASCIVATVNQFLNA